MKKLLLAAFLSVLLHPAFAWREDFNSGDPDRQNMPVGWETEGVLPGVPASKAFVKDGVLRLESTRSSGGVLRIVEGVDLKKTPIMRWRWRAVTLPPGADGANPEKDDQAVGIYVVLPGMLGQKSVSYHYETETPKNTWGKASYYLGVVKVQFLVLRNKTDQTGEWYTEERNVLEDLKKCYNTVPEKFGVSIQTNAHNTKTKAAAEVDYVEFIAPGTPPRK